jgi:hypothetical protein
MTLTNEQQGFLKSVYDMKMEDLRITGHIKVKGESLLPVQGKVMLLVGNVTFGDGRQISVVNTGGPILVNPDTNEKITQGATITETSMGVSQ